MVGFGRECNVNAYIILELKELKKKKLTIKQKNTDIKILYIVFIFSSVKFTNGV